jgi:hypothetical protein
VGRTVADAVLAADPTNARSADRAAQSLLRCGAEVGVDHHDRGARPLPSDHTVVWLLKVFGACGQPRFLQKLIYWRASREWRKPPRTRCKR